MKIRYQQEGKTTYIYAGPKLVLLAVMTGKPFEYDFFRPVAFGPAEHVATARLHTTLELFVTELIRYGADSRE